MRDIFKKIRGEFNTQKAHAQAQRIGIDLIAAKFPKLISERNKETKVALANDISVSMREEVFKRDFVLFGKHFNALKSIAMNPADMDKLALLPQASWLLGIASLNASGYVREPALRNLLVKGSPKEILIFMLARLNDHVEPIHDLAVSAITKRINKDPVADLLEFCAVFAYLDRLKFTQGLNISASVIERIKKEGVDIEVIKAFHQQSPLLQKFLLTALRDHLRKDPETFADLLLGGSTAVKRQMIRDFESACFTDAMLRHLFKDKSAPVRRSALLKISAKHVADLTAEIKDLLHDNSPQVRETARYLLGLAGIGDFATHYRQLLQQPRYAKHPGVIMGLTEVAEYQDLGLIRQHVDHTNKMVRRTILGKLNQMDGDALPIIQNGLQDHSGSVREMAVRILRKENGTQDGVIRDLFRSGTYPVKLACLKVLAVRKNFAALNDIILAGLEDTPQTPFPTHELLDAWRQKYPHIYEKLDKEFHAELSANLNRLDPKKKRYPWLHEILAFSVK